VDTLRLFGPAASARPAAASSYEADDALRLFGLGCLEAGPGGDCGGPRGGGPAAAALPAGRDVVLLWQPQPNAFHGPPALAADGAIILLCPVLVALPAAADLASGRSASTEAGGTRSSCEEGGVQNNHSR
jgi:hypothetical protein